MIFDYDIMGPSTPTIAPISVYAQALAGLVAEATSFDPAKDGLPVTDVNILLVGGVGSGKCSFNSTIDGLLKGRQSRRAPNGSGTGSLTTALKHYTFRDRDGKALRWNLWDTMGWEDDLRLMAAMPFILEGQLVDGCRLDQKVDTRSTSFKHDAQIQDAVHCVLIVMPCDSATDPSYLHHFCFVRDEARQRGEQILNATCRSLGIDCTNV